VALDEARALPGARPVQELNKAVNLVVIAAVRESEKLAAQFLNP